MFVNKLVGAAFVCVLGFMSGCGGNSGPTLHKVSGIVTHKGQPLSNITIKFAPVDGEVYSSATPDEQGRFTLQYTMHQPGVVAGENVVYVEYRPSTPEEESESAKPAFQPPAPYKEVIAKYGTKAKSSYKVTIDDSQDNLQVTLD